MNLRPVACGVRVTLSLVWCVRFVDRLSFCASSFDHCVVRSSSIYRFWLPIWYLQTFLSTESICLFRYIYHWNLVYSFVFLLEMTLGFKSYDFERTWWRLFQNLNVPCVINAIYRFLLEYIAHTYESRQWSDVNSQFHKDVNFIYDIFKSTFEIWNLQSNGRQYCYPQ